MPNEQLPNSFVAVFFRSRGGELRCRVTEVATHATWGVQRPESLWLLLAEGREKPPREGEEDPR